MTNDVVIKKFLDLLYDRPRHTDRINVTRKDAIKWFYPDHVLQMMYMDSTYFMANLRTGTGVFGIPWQSRAVAAHLDAVAQALYQHQWTQNQYEFHMRDRYVRMFVRKSGILTMYGFDDNYRIQLHDPSQGVQSILPLTTEDTRSLL